MLVVGGVYIGDFIQILPAIECLGANFPAASISILLSSKIKGVLCLFPKRNIISEIIETDFEGKHKSFLRKLVLFLSLRRKGYELVYSPQRGKMMREGVLISFLIGSKHRLGFKKGRVGLLNTLKIEFKEDIPILKQNLAILKAANLEVNKQEIELKVPEKDVATAKKLLTEHTLINCYPLVAIHPGASWNAKYKRWPLEKYISLITVLLKELGAKIIIIGSKSEIEMSERILGKIQDSAVISTVGKTTVAQMAGLIKLSHLFIGNDSAPLHIASALKIPTVAIFGSTSPKQMLSDHSRCVVIKKNLPGLPCYLHQPDFVFDDVNMDSLNLITIDDVMDGVRRAIGGRF